MKKALLMLALICYASPYLYGQELLTDIANYKVVYNLEYQRDSTDLNSKSNEKMALLIGDKFSLFQSVNDRYNDSVQKELAKSDKDVSILMKEVITQRKPSRYDFIILKSNEETLVYDSYFGDKFIYKEEEKLKWEITKTTQQISGYHCTLAKTVFAGRHYNAWFTNEIPISDGPYKFRGLPGLIVKIEDTRKHYTFELESFTKTKETFKFDKKAGIKASKKEFLTSYNNFKKNFLGELDQRGIYLEKSPSRDKKIRMQRARNNEIEISY